MKGFLGCYNRLQQKDFTARGISAFELPNKKSKELHLRIEVKHSAPQLDNSSAFFPEFAISAWKKIYILL